jgi:hypothetical protein
MLFPEAAPLVSQNFINSYYNVSSIMDGFNSSSWVLDAFQRLNRAVTFRDQLFARLKTETDLRPFIQAEALRLTQGQKVVDVAALLDDLAQLRQPGLRTLRAPNGSGKTTFFTLCRARFGDDALFLPNHHQLNFGLPQGSSGQTTMAILKTIDAMPKKPALIFLDEWDANLDENNRAAALAMIERWSQDVCVVQAVHRG